jgi:Cation transport ATPase
MTTMTAAAPAPSAPPLAEQVRGLTSIDARRLLAKYGPNELARAQKMGVFRQLLRGLTSPLMLILLGASALAASVGEVTDAVIIMVTVLLGTALDAYQTSRSTSAVERLRDSVIPTATVMRDGQWVEIRVARWSPATQFTVRRRCRTRRRAPRLQSRSARPAGSADGRVAAGREGG